MCQDGVILANRNWRTCQTACIYALNAIHISYIQAVWQVRNWLTLKTNVKIETGNKTFVIQIDATDEKMVFGI